MDKMVKLKATRNAYYSLMVGFGFTFLALVFGMPVWGVFIAFFAFGLVTEIIENLSQIVYYRRGV